MEYFPTTTYQRAVLLMRSLLSRERDRLDSLAEASGRDTAITEANFARELPEIVRFAKAYQEAFMRYLSAVLPQHPSGISCRAGCGNCCHHFPMSVEPFELALFYAEIRNSRNLLSILEKCQFRSKSYRKIFRLAEIEGISDPDDFALVRYFGAGLSCPFILSSGSCGVYAFRPVTCRMYFSETPGKFCVPEHLLTDKNRSFIVYLPDELEELIADISAHYAELALPESLYEGILAMNVFEPDFVRAEHLAEIPGERENG